MIGVKRVYYLTRKPYFTDQTDDIRLIEHSIRDSLFDLSNDYNTDRQPVCRKHAVDRHGWGYRRL